MNQQNNNFVQNAQQITGQPGNPTQQADNNSPSQISTGGFTPEAMQGPVKPAEVTRGPETGYEKIQELERKAEQIERKEGRQPQPKPLQKEIKKRIGPEREKKEVPVSVAPKYFGYRPPAAFMANPKKIKGNVGKGHRNDSMTWLLFFLDRLYKKENK